MRTPLIAGNWKMHLNLDQAAELAAAVAGVAEACPDREVMIAPPFTALARVREVAGERLILAGQNVCWEEKGAFTGEIAPPMLRELGCRMAIVGHSERRHVFGEDDAMVNRRLRGAMAHGLVPILCIGETLDEREAGQTMAVLERQVRDGLQQVEISEAAGLVIAYEPVWAIGTGKTASPDQAQEAHEFVRRLLCEVYEKNIAAGIRILYGGSVNAANVDEIMAQADVDGALVGGASLSAETFERIIRFA
ncbi:triose-phosphate isomerase [Desulfurivibrio alkaliphilus]|uniref:Triosephosphate isomerase n=1 Tax=Desulfurivibrio alkaliphilus (strain DSM 19089 / UNIQEM U267 / AHT2) TaxID=589865 RepID=D6Z594_DESAT|nr:triose-phosphate isomerase [Desulfurivibrio alkaliphilus]ADH84751.1 triosephosphate isomerase [Desulfurivibrio alkaliphilus AHT 2]